MKPQAGYYSLVQYCPDLSRLEAANIGVLLFCPDSHFLRVMTSTDNSRIKRFFGTAGHDWQRIRMVKRALQDRLDKEQHSIRTLEDLQQFMATRANQVQMTIPRPIKVHHPEQELAELYQQLIEQPTHRATQPGIRRILQAQFEAAGLSRKLQEDVQIEVPILGKTIELPFGFQNGRFNLISPVRFGGDQAFRTASQHAVQGRSIYEHRDQKYGPLQLVVVGQFRPHDKESPELVRRVLEHHNVKLYVADELKNLVDEIQRTGKDLW